MPLPTRSDVLTLDYTGAGQPAAYIEAKTLSPASATLDYTLAAQPVFGLPDGAPPPPPTSAGSFFFFFNSP
jgi:hypothetical protein